MSTERGSNKEQGLPVLVVVDHGSRSAEANQTLGCLVRLVQSQAGPGVRVFGAHLSSAPPDLPTVLDEAARCASIGVTVMPYFLAPGKHARVDVPEIVGEAQKRHPAVSFRVAEPLGVDPLLGRLVLQRAGLKLLCDSVESCPNSPMDCPHDACPHRAHVGTATGQ